MIRRTWILAIACSYLVSAAPCFGEEPPSLEEFPNLLTVPTAIESDEVDHNVIPAPGPEVGVNVGHNRPIPPYSGFLGSETGNISVDWVAPQNFVIGQESDFELVLRNRGPVAVMHVEVSPTFPAGFRFVKSVPALDNQDGQPVWKFNKLEPQQEARIRMRLHPERVGNAKGHARVTFSASSSTAFNVVEPKLKVVADAPKTAIVGSQVVFNVTVTNPGSGKAGNVKLDVQLPPGLVRTAKSSIYGLGVLNPGESRSIRIVANVAELGDHASKFVATADHGLRDMAAKDVRGLGAKLETTLDGPDFRYVTRPAIYTLRVKNSGTTAAENVHLHCSVPKPFAFLEAEQRGTYDAASKSINWFLGSLALGDEIEVKFKLRALAPGQFPIIARAEAERGLGAQSRHVTRVAGIAAILLEVVDVDDPVEVGTETMYEILVTNQGTEFATGLTIDAKVPPGLTITDSTGPSAGQVDGQTIRFDPLPRLAPRADAVYRIKVQGNQPGDFRIEVQAKVDTLDAPVTELESTKVYQD